ncbi:hypothetical protein C8R45DRAFT_405791 [Mycena sanguinolenta]|nr:hypothetical protein C8R45DRAFT_405791 [Mycena sanguinolenta]
MLGYEYVQHLRKVVLDPEPDRDHVFGSAPARPRTWLGTQRPSRRPLLLSHRPDLFRLRLPRTKRPSGWRIFRSTPLHHTTTHAAATADFDTRCRAASVPHHKRSPRRGLSTNPARVRVRGWILSSLGIGTWDANRHVSQRWRGRTTLDRAAGRARRSWVLSCPRCRSRTGEATALSSWPVGPARCTLHPQFGTDTSRTVSRCSIMTRPSAAFAGCRRTVLEFLPWSRFCARLNRGERDGLKIRSGV